MIITGQVIKYFLLILVITKAIDRKSLNSLHWNMKSLPRLSSCHLCNGAGYLVRDAGKGGKVRTLVLCECQSQPCSTCEGDGKPPYMYFDLVERVLRPCACLPGRSRLDNMKILFHQSRIPGKYRYRRLEEFRHDAFGAENRTELAMVHDMAFQFLEQFDRDDITSLRGLFFYGPPGTGKTFLSSLILNEIIFRYAMEVRYLKITRNFFNEIRSTYNTSSEQYGRGEDIFRELAGKEVLVIDDFGVQADSEWEKRMLYDLIDLRYEEEKPTIITSNKEPAFFEELFDRRVLSRLKEMMDFQMIMAPDFRERFQ